ncbi:GTP-binding protein [Vibrio vulnificus]|uniref:CobW family GTP-binding protein n=1 Tax=Vibrio vulnificus TaxID=672 RepID=UPI00102A1E1F|nr:GTP-binding protein [Vibrio vulnificus]EGR7978025.1 GTP-binding protein [Vibrio vulnificus]ELS0750847.1 GTP-binding protein [Vibrio vulnificus]MCA3908187.1 GTP-binding protein [Vibrio vulnificus]MCU8111735.1 GTP-binding protein [Vibrio vulnificus]RZP87405.1 GTP-binding protein [Vibrio vulnificus]
MSSSENLNVQPFNMASVVNSTNSRRVEERFNEAHEGMMGMLMAAYKVQQQQLKVADHSLPLTIIGGFLGAGKTTLLNELLTAPHGKRLVVLVNDFGKVNIDAELIASQTEDMINLSNGCACCSVSADLTDSLLKLADRDELPDAVVLEASGVADPNGIVQVAHTIPAIRLDGGLAVVDAETIFVLAQDSLTSRLFHNQISAADLIVLTKVDLVEEAHLKSVHQWLGANYPTKKVIEAVNGHVPTEIVLGIETSQNSGFEQPGNTEYKHDFASVSFTIGQALDQDKLSEFFANLPKSMLRVKGVINTVGTPDNKLVYQQVGQRGGFSTSEAWGNEVRHSSLVFIGPKGSLDKEQLEAQLSSCIA